MSEKKPEEEFDWTQALADWAHTTFAPEPPERKRSVSPPTRSRAPSIPNIDPALLPDLTRPSVPPPKFHPAEPEEAAPTEEPAQAESAAEPSTRTLYRSTGATTARSRPSEPRMVPVSPVEPTTPEPAAPATAAEPAEVRPAEGSAPASAPAAAVANEAFDFELDAPAEEPAAAPDVVTSVPEVIAAPDVAAAAPPAPAPEPPAEVTAVVAAPEPAPQPALAAPPPPAAPPSAPAPLSVAPHNRPPAASVSLRAPANKAGGASTLGELLGAEPSDDELDALLDGFPDEPAAAPAVATPAAAAPPATPPQSTPEPIAPPHAVAEAAPPAPASSETSRSTSPPPRAWPADEEEPTAVRALPRAEINAIFAEQGAPPPEPATTAASATPHADSVTAIRIATPSTEALGEADDDAVTATKLPDEKKAEPAPDSVTALRPPEPSRPASLRPMVPTAKQFSPMAAPPPSAPIATPRPVPTPRPLTTPRPSPAKPLLTPKPSTAPKPLVTPAPSVAPKPAVTAKAFTPPASTPPEPPPAASPSPDSVTALRVATPIAAFVPNEAKPPPPAAPAAPVTARGPSGADVFEVTASNVDVSELPELEDLGPAGEGDLDAAPTAALEGSGPPSGDVAPWGADRPAATWFDDASREGFIARAAWLEDEARKESDRTARARGLLVVSELYALVGDTDAAVARAREARDLVPQLALAHRQLRGLLGFDDPGMLETLEQSLRTTPSVTAKMHDALLAADVLRLGGDEEDARKRYEQAARIGAQDARLVVARAGMALAKNDTSSIALRIPDAEGLTPFARAATSALRLRGIEVRGAPADTAASEPVRRARAVLEKGDLAKAIAAIDEIAADDALKQGAIWLTAAFATAQDAPAEAARRLGDAVDARSKRWLAARALEAGDATAARRALASEEVFRHEEQLMLLLLTGASADDVRMATSLVAGVAEDAPLTSAAAGLRTPLDGHVAGDASARHSVHLGRLLAANAAPHAVASAVAELATDRPDTARALVLDSARDASRFGEIADALARWGGAVPDAEARLAAALVAERGGDATRARDAYRTLLEQDPTNRLAMRALGALDGDRDETKALRARAEALGAGPEAAITEIELYAHLGATDAGIEALERASAADPSLAIPHLMLERAARQRGDLERVVAAVRARRSVMTDPMETALDGVREALLIADTEAERAAEILLEAHQARPDDVALRELYERLTALPPAERAAWRERRAAQAKGPAKTLWLLEAAQLYSLAGDATSALRVAADVAGPTPDGLARIALEDAELAAESVSRLSDELLSRAKTAEDLVHRREAYERLAEMDAARHDAASAILWHRSVLEESPDYLPSLRYIEHVLVGDARDEELEPIAAAVAKRLIASSPAEGAGHAALAAWLRARVGDHASVDEMAALARSREPAPLWSLRAWSTEARRTGDHQADHDAAAALLARTERTSEQVTLATRMGDALLRLGRQSDAVKAYENAASLDAGDVPTWQKLADARRAAGDKGGAATALESLARTSKVETHRLTAWYEAGLAWSDLGDDARARMALEQAARIDVMHADVFGRLSAVYMKVGRKAELAELLEERTKHVTDENERLALEVERGRLLTETGEPARARKALEAALAIQPDHSGALDAFADLCMAAGDHAAAEQSWVRLTRLLATPDEQREVYRKLGVLYADHLGNLSRAELAFREVQKRAPDDVETIERLVGIYMKQNDAARALEMQGELVTRATAPAERRDRLVGLSRIYETTARDLRKAEQALESARKELPQDVTLLRALAEFYTRHRQMPAVHILLDRTAGDVRRALAAGRFAPAAFEIMTTVYELRGQEDAAKLVGASLAAIEGRPANLAGAEARAGDPALDDLLAPELVSPAFRSLLARAGEALDVLAPVDLKSLRAAALPPQHPLTTLAAAIAHGMGLPPVQVHVSPQIGMMCVPVSTNPPAIVLGEAVLQSPLAAARGFLFVRAIKLLQARCGALVRIPPKDSATALGAYFRAFNPSWEPPGVPAPLVADALKRLSGAMPKRNDPDAGLLALEAAGGLFQQPQAVASALLAWANRTALLAVGDPNAAIDAMAWSAGMNAGAPAGEARAAFIARTAEARDLLVFSLSDAYAEARKRTGLHAKK